MKTLNHLAVYFTIILIISQSLHAQNNVGIGTTTPRAKALLDLNASNLGLLLPRVDRTLVTPGLVAADNGLLVYDTTVGSQGVWYWDGAAWALVSAFGSQAANTVFSAPNGVAGLPSFRLLVANDIPNLNTSKLTAGTLPIARGGTNSTAAPVNGGLAYGTGTAYAFTPAGTAGQILQSNGSAAPAWVNPNSFGWGLTGNAIGGTDFIGTTNAQAFRIRTNNVQRMVVDANGFVGIGTTSPASEFELSALSPVLTIRTTGSGVTESASLQFVNSGGSLLGSIGDPGSGTYLQVTSPTSMVFNTNFNDRMLIANNGDVGIGVSPASTRLEVRGSGNTGSTLALRLTNSSANTLFTVADNGVLTAPGLVGPGVVVSDASGNLSVSSGSPVVGSGAATRVAFWNSTNALSSSANLFWDNTNNRLGIGTSSPNSIFHVRGVVSPNVSLDTGVFVDVVNNAGVGNAMTGVRFKMTNNTDNSRYNAGVFYHSQGGSSGWLSFSVKANSLSNVGLNDAKMVIDAQGNVGIMTTTPTGILDVRESFGGDRVLLANGRNVRLGDIDAGGVGTNLLIDGDGAGNFQFINGNVGIGTTSPGNFLHIAAEGLGGLSITTLEGHSGTATRGPGINMIRSKGTLASPAPVAAGDYLGGIVVSGRTASAYNLSSAVDFHVDGTVVGSSVPGRITFSTTTAGASTTTEKMRITNAGNVGIGTSSPAGKLHIENTDWNNTPVILNSTASSAGSTLRFTNPAVGNRTYDIIGSTGTGSDPGVGCFGIWDHTNSAYRVVIGSTGNVGIGTTAPENRLDVRNTVIPALIYNTTNSTVADGMRIRAGSTSGSGAWIIDFRRNDNSQIGTVFQNSAASVSYNTTSDLRLKNISGITVKGLEDLMRINIYDYSYKDDVSGKSFTGFVAQELHQVFPQSVTPPRYGEGDSPEQNPWMVDYGSISPLLVKAIQDQQKIIEELKSRIEELEKR